MTDGLRIITGGQTGVDRAALDAAMRYGVACGGYCPRDYWAEDGKISTHYPLVALEDDDPEARTRANVGEADGLCIVSPEPVSGGTAEAMRHAEQTTTPTLHLDGLDPDTSRLISQLEEWFQSLAGS